MGGLRSGIDLNDFAALLDRLDDRSWSFPSSTSWATCSVSIRRTTRCRARHRV